jgi:hypothetical protein
MKKDIVITMRFSVTDSVRLLELAEHYEIPASAVTRMLVKRDFERLGLKPKSRRRTTK